MSKFHKKLFIHFSVVFTSSHLTTVTLVFGLPFPVPSFSTLYTDFISPKTLPKTTCLPSNQGVGAVVIKNYEPLVLGPALAIDNTPTAC